MRKIKIDPKQAKVQQLSVRMDVEQYKQFRVTCAYEGKSMASVLLELVTKYLKENKRT